MDVRAKQLRCYERNLLTLSLCVFGFAPRHLNHWAAVACFVNEYQLYEKIKTFLFHLYCHGIVGYFAFVERAKQTRSEIYRFV